VLWRRSSRSRARCADAQGEPYAEAGRELAREGKHEEACDMFAEALRINPRNERAWVDWASALAELGRYREACEKLRRAREFGWGPQIWDERGAPVGAVWEEKARCEEACEKHAKAVEASPQDARAYLHWGIALGKLGRHAESCEKYATALEIDPQDPEVYTNWAPALAELGRDAEACEKYARADEGGRLPPAAYLAWAEALARAGDRAEAIRKLNRAVGLSARLKPQVEEIRKQLLGEE